MVTLRAIENWLKRKDEIEDFLFEFGRRVYKHRYDRDLLNVHFASFDIREYDKFADYNSEYAFEDQQIIIITYFDGYDYIEVKAPTYYIDIDWTHIEDELRLKKIVAERKFAEEANEESIRRRRSLYEKLKKEFE